MSNLALDPINLLQSAGAPTGAFRIGDTYFDTTANAIFVYNGTAWVQDAALSNTQTFTAANTFAPTSTSVAPLTVNLPNGSAQNLLTLKTNGNTWFSVATYGYTSINGFSSSSSSQILNAAPASIVLKIKGAASQTANLTEWQDSSGAVLAKIDSAGNLTAANFSTTVTALDGGVSDSIAPYAGGKANASATQTINGGSA